MQDMNSRNIILKFPHSVVFIAMTLFSRKDVGFGRVAVRASFSYSKWNRGEPNNADKIEDCLEMDKDDKGWNDVNCGETRKFKPLCQIGGWNAWFCNCIMDDGYGLFYLISVIIWYLLANKCYKAIYISPCTVCSPFKLKNCSPFWVQKIILETIFTPWFCSFGFNHRELNTYVPTWAKSWLLVIVGPEENWLKLNKLIGMWQTPTSLM